MCRTTTSLDSRTGHVQRTGELPATHRRRQRRQAAKAQAQWLFRGPRPLWLRRRLLPLRPRRQLHRRRHLHRRQSRPGSQSLRQHRHRGRRGHRERQGRRGIWIGAGLHLHHRDRFHLPQFQKKRRLKCRDRSASPLKWAQPYGIRSEIHKGLMDITLRGGQPSDQNLMPCGSHLRRPTMIADSPSSVAG